MLKDYFCIVCPNGCEITAETENGEILSLSGAKCKRGNDYVKQELIDPRRSIATSVLLLDGKLPLVSVRATNSIPKDQIFQVMEEIKKVKLHAPVFSGQVAIENVLGLGSDVIVTKNVERQ